MSDYETPVGGSTGKPQKKIVIPGGAAHVDEDWKAQAKRESEELDEKLEAQAEAERRALPEASFLQFLSGIATQALMQLGVIENPFLQKKSVDLDAARYSIDIIGILEQKTKGNLTPDEERYVKAAIHDLRMRYVEVASGKAPAE